MSESVATRRRVFLVVGVIVVAVALWLLLDAAGVGVPGLGKVWPLFVLLGGVASLVDYFIGSRSSASLGRGVFGIGLGILFFTFSLGSVDWRTPSQWWPAVPLILGGALLASWVAGRMKNHVLLILGIVSTGLGLSGLAERMEWLRRLMPSPVVFWALALLVIGGYMIWRFSQQKKGGS